MAEKIEQPVHYAIVRADLPFGVQGAMLMHAVGVTAVDPHEPGMWCLALHARDEAHLLEAARDLERAGIAHVVYRDPDPPHNGAAMAIGVFPVPGAERERVKKCLQRWPLVDSPPRKSVRPLPPVAQSVEQRTSSPQADGSIPSRGSK